MTATIKLTPARRRALEVLAAAGPDRRLRVSNETNDACVYWQSADWLLSQGLASTHRGELGEYIGLTEPGRLLASTL